jgi:hypothetical protein
MNQILHIFRKDVRHRWTEILVSLALLIAHAWHVAHQWNVPSQDFNLTSSLWGALPVFLPASWCFLVIRAVQEESLVGDRQFWVTRPYEWKKLLAAKLLFVAASINLPLFIVDVVLLAKAGFSPVRYLPGLLWMQVLLVIFLVVPAAAVSVVTSTVVQVLLCVLGLVLYLIGVGQLFSSIPNAGMSPGSDVAVVLDLLVIGCVLVAAIFLQYARRKTWTSRLLIIGGAVAVLLIGAVTPYGTIVARSYPPLTAGQEPAVTLTIDPTPPLPPKKKDNAFPDLLPNVWIALPVRASGVAEGHVAQVRGTVVTIQASDGQHWTSSWNSNGSTFWPGGDRSVKIFAVDRKFFERVKSIPVNVHISVAQVDYRETNARQITAKDGKFSIAGVGICRIEPYGNSNQNMIACRAPLKSPSLLGHMDPSATTCTYEDGPPPLITRYMWDVHDDSMGPADLGIIPVNDVQMMFQSWADNPKRELRYFCPGTPFTIGTPEEGKHSRTEMEIDGIKLSQYEWHPGQE